MKQNKRFLLTLLDLLKFHTWSGNEEIMQEYMIQQLQTLGFKYKIDDMGNICAVRGKASKYPLLNAHMDIVHDVDKSIENQIPKRLVSTTQSQISSTATTHDRACKNCENKYDCASLMADDKTKYPTWSDAYEWLCEHGAPCASYIYDGYGRVSYSHTDLEDDDDWEYSNAYYRRSWSGSTVTTYYWHTAEEKRQMDKLLDKQFVISYDPKTQKISSNKLRILGGDDKCGIAIALQVAREMPHTPMKLLFTVKEESGCIGVDHFCTHNKEWFADVAYSLTIDRRYGDNLLPYACGKRNCTPEFAAKIAYIGVKSGVDVKIDHGTIADVMEIRNLVAETVNMSAGYYNPHSTSEYIQFDDMLLVKKWVKNILTEVNI